jgi:PST family polysaccharide transporter
MQLIKSSFWSGLSVAVRSLGSFLLNKIIAVYYGPSGLSLFSHFQGLIAIFISIPVDGINPGVVRYLSAEDPKLQERRKIFSTSIFLSFLWTVISSIIILFFGKQIFKIFPFIKDFTSWYIPLLIVLPLQIISYLFLSFLVAAQKLKIYLFASILNFILPLVIILTGSSPAFRSTLLFWAYSSVTGLLVSSLSVYKSGILKLYKPDLESIKKIGAFVLMASIILIFGKGTDYIIRQYIITNYSAHVAGLWQSGMKISEYYTGGLVAIIGIMYFPQITRLLNDYDQLRLYIRKVLFLFVPLIIGGLTLIYFFRPFFLQLFFDKEFIGASSLMHYILLGDVFKLIAFFPAYLITAQTRTRLFVITEASSAIVYLTCAFIFTRFMGVEGIPFAQFIRSVSYFILVFYLYRRIIF